METIQILETRRIHVPAMIDGKDVTTDWIEGIFDSCDFAYDTRIKVGFINHCVVEARWEANKVIWTISTELGYGNTLDALFTLDERLRRFEDEESGVYSIFELVSIPNYQIIQKFYFKED